MELDSLKAPLLEYTQDIVSVIDESGEFQYVNEAATQLLGYERTELVGENAFEYIPSGDRKAALETFTEVVSADVPTTETHEHRFTTADGQQVHLESRLSNCTDERINGYVISSRDVTERKRAQKERAMARERLEEIAGTAGDVLWMFSADWEELLFVNSAYEEVFGETVEELHEDPSTFIDAIHPDDRERVRAGMERISEGESTELEYRVNPDRDYSRWVWVQGEPVIEDGEVVRVVGFTRDVTDRRRRERQLAVMDNLLRHNLRNDMSIILGNAEEIADDGEGPHAERADRIIEQGERLVATAQKQRAVIDLLTSRSNPGPMDAVDAVADAVEVVQDRFPDATIELDLPESAEVIALRELERAVVELLENAIEHDGDDHPTVHVSVTDTGEAVEILVADQCPSIPEVEYRILTGDWEMDDVYHTSGLGLWLVYWIVDLSQGEISFAQDDTGGNTIRVALPRDESV